MRFPSKAALLITAAALLAGCAPAGEATVVPPSTTTPTPSPSATVDPLTVGPVQPVGEPVTVASGLSAPWSIVRLENGSTLVSERDSGLVKEVLADGSIRDVGAVPGAAAQGEGGLLGLAVAPADSGDGEWLYAYATTAADNRILRFDLTGEAGSLALGPDVEIVTGIARAGNHNGGRIAIGPDDKLYATVGDASQPDLAQDPASLSGKILRMELDGSAPADNPFPGTLVYSIGHRNPQGITWDRDGRLWAAEFGQDTWDEINLITPGANYGWPVVEGVSGDPAYTNPVQQWGTDDASPSGLAFVRDTLFMAGLGGERLWRLEADGSAPTEWFTSQFGRIRDVVAGPEGSLWMLTNNTDGRGDPREGDDRILQVELG